MKSEPRTGLGGIADATLTGKTRKERAEIFGFALRNFLDSFSRAKQFEKRAILRGDEPKRLKSALGDGGVADAYLAALANHLARDTETNPPSWADTGAGRLPDKPWFAMNSPEARIWLLTQSPAAFRERNLFISEDALARA